MTQVLYRKWRPKTFDEVVGQEHVTQTLRNALALGRVAHAYLFAGLRGTGKTTMARLVAKAVNCLAEEPGDRPCNQCTVCRAVNEGRFLDLIEIDAASHTGVDDVRELRDKVGFRPNEGRYKVYIIDEVHRFSVQAFDALLKTIEEPPEHAIFILATTEIHKVPATILSRCQRFDFRRIPVQQITQRLQQLAKAEGIKAEPEALTLIARSATGSLRDAESLLDQLSAANTEGVTLAQVQVTLGTIDVELVASLVDCLVARDVAEGLSLIDQALDQGADLRQFTRQIVNHLRGMLLIKLDGAELLDMSGESRERLVAQAGEISTPALVEAIKRFNQIEVELKGGWQPQLPLELALVEASLWQGHNASAPVGSDPQPVSFREGPQSTAQDFETVKASGEPEPEIVAHEEPGIPTTEGSTSSAALTLQLVQQHWRRVLDNARERDKSVQALLNSTQPGEAENQIVTLYVAHEFAREKLSQPRAKRLVEDLLGEVLGQDCHVDYKVVALPDRVVSGEAPGQETASAGSGRRGSRDAWANDPLARAARQLGAEVRPIDEGSET
jgi:DNA polymerase-3 subunit gamma/tau